MVIALLIIVLLMLGISLIVTERILRHLDELRTITGRMSKELDALYKDLRG